MPELESYMELRARRIDVPAQMKHTNEDTQGFIF